MALFIDSPPATIEDLRGYESSILHTAGTEEIDLTGKLEAAWREMQIKLEAFLRRETWGHAPGYGESIGSVVVTPALHRTHTLATLHLIYRDAVTRHSNGRYGDKAAWYEGAASEALDELFESGVGLAEAAVRKARKAEWTLLEGGLTGSGYYLRTSWVNAQGAEGEASVPQYIDNPNLSGEVLVTQHQQGITDAGWNVYMGCSLDAVFRQNEHPIQPGESWTQSNEPGTDGSAPSNGQEPRRFIRRRRILWRG